VREDWPLGLGLQESKEGKKEHEHLAQADDNELTLLMVCALNDAVKEPKSRVEKSISIDESRA
jgi:hypothetical protein